MKLLRILVLISCVFISRFCVVKAQSFPGEGGRIRDFVGVVKADTFRIAVNGLPPETGLAFGLAIVCLNVSHPRVSDLKIELMSPQGTSIWLSNRNGRDDGQDYTNTCFRSNGFSGFIHQAKAPFQGEYIPDGRLTFLNDGQNPNGVWRLIVSDLKAEEAGNLNYVTLTFSDDPTPNAERNPCAFENGVACACPDGKSSCELLPDLFILPRFTQTQIQEYAKDDPNYPGQLRFAVSIGNIGDGPMETLGKREWYCQNKRVDSLTRCADGSTPRQHIYQRIYSRQATGLTAQDRLAGTNYFDNQPGHNHYHVDNWVEFRLVKSIIKNETKVYKTLVSKGRKVSYCLFDSGICNNKDSLCGSENRVYGERNLINYGLGDYTDCKSGKQGISVGGYDTYGLLYEGQYLQLPKGLKSGKYILEVEVDPNGIYKEKTKANNLFSMPVYITKQE